ncbi:MAG: hypothetical protein M3P26_17310 [Gemmatimonadota bacterium]|nr:hypothetical protein [Gemmatimonadota bacterium]
MVRTICQHCNRHTGGSYGTAFKEFALQFASSGLLFTPEQRRAFISLKQIQPLRVLKQLGAMVLAAQPEQPNARWRKLQEFVLRRDRRLDGQGGRFYLYRNVSGLGRISALAGIGMLYSSVKVPLVFSEISWPPLGLIYAIDPHPLLSAMKDITDWGQYGFRDRESFNFSVPQYRVEANWPFAFGTKREAQTWSEQNHVMLIAIGATDGDNPTQLSSIIERHRRRRKGA